MVVVASCHFHLPSRVVFRVFQVVYISLYLDILQVDWVEPGKDGKMTEDW